MYEHAIGEMDVAKKPEIMVWIGKDRNEMKVIREH